MNKLNLRCMDVNLCRPNEVAQRFREIPKFFDIHKGFIKQPVLDIGPPNYVGERLFKMYGWEYHWTEGDLSREWKPSHDLKYKTVICFEVLEHLINPGICLDNIKKHCVKDASIFVSVPRRGLFDWQGSNMKFTSDLHFHEFDKKRIQCLWDECGYEVLDETHFIRSVLLKDLFGWWKPIVRTLTGRQLKIIVRNYLYFLKFKGQQ